MLTAFKVHELKSHRLCTWDKKKQQRIQMTPLLSATIPFIFLLPKEIKEERIIKSIFEGSDFVVYNTLISDTYC